MRVEEREREREIERGIVVVRPVSRNVLCGVLLRIRERNVLLGRGFCSYGGAKVC